MCKYTLFFKKKKKSLNQVCNLTEETHQSTQLEAQAATTFNKKS